MRITHRHPLPEHRADGSVWVPACDIYDAVSRTTQHYAVPPHRAVRIVRSLPGLARTAYYRLRVDHPLQQQAPAVIEWHQRAAALDRAIATT